MLWDFPPILAIINLHRQNKKKKVNDKIDKSGKNDKNDKQMADEEQEQFKHLPSNERAESVSSENPANTS